MEAIASSRLESISGVRHRLPAGSDPEELRFSLEDVGVSYEDREFSLVGRPWANVEH